MSAEVSNQSLKINADQLEDGETLLNLTSQKSSELEAVGKSIEDGGRSLKGPLELDLKITKIEPDFVLQGKLNTGVSLVCDRCAEPFSHSISQSFALAYRRRAAKDPKDEGEAAGDIAFFGGDILDLEPVVTEQFELALPYQAHCRADCQGICQDCGQNLNLGPCECKRVGQPNPFSVLEKLKKP